MVQPSSTNGAPVTTSASGAPAAPPEISCAPHSSLVASQFMLFWDEFAYSKQDRLHCGIQFRLVHLLCTSASRFACSDTLERFRRASYHCSLVESSRHQCDTQTSLLPLLHKLPLERLATDVANLIVPIETFATVHGHVWSSF